MKLGDTVIQRPTIGEHRASPMPGRVVYIHPEGRFYTLEFIFQSRWGRGTLRESFYPHQAPED